MGAPFQFSAHTKNLRARSGFSLVEVTIALGICSFCILAVLGLLPVGINTNRDTVEQTQAASIARAVQTDLETVSANEAATPRFGIALPATITASSVPNATLFVAEDCNSTNATAANAGGTVSRYRVDVAFGARSASSAPIPVRILVTWPALANPQVAQWPTKQSGGFDVVTALNP